MTNKETSSGDVIGWIMQFKQKRRPDWDRLKGAGSTRPPEVHVIRLASSEKFTPLVVRYADVKLHRSICAKINIAIPIRRKALWIGEPKPSPTQGNECHLWRVATSPWDKPMTPKPCLNRSAPKLRACCPESRRKRKGIYLF